MFPLAGSLLRLYLPDAKPHTRGVALISADASASTRHQQADALAQWHPDNAVLARDQFYADPETAWAAPAKKDTHHGAPLLHFIVAKDNPDNKAIVLMASPEEVLAQERALFDADSLPALRGMLLQKEISCAWLNHQLAAPQTQCCLRLYLSGEADNIRLIKGYEIEEELLTLLHLEKRELPAGPGRRMMDLIGLFDRFGSAVQLLECSREGHVRFHVAFEAEGKSHDPVRAYSEGTALDFLEDFSRLGLKELFRS